MRVLPFILTVLVLAACSRKNCYDHNQDLISIKEANQKMLDTGVGMLSTEKRFNLQTDSILNLIIFEFEQVDRQYWHVNLKREMNVWESQKQVDLDSLWFQIQNEVNEFGFASEIAQLQWYGTSSDYNYEKAIELNQIKLEMCNQ
jgi:RNAse (barnase) inhibitor barstar|tara:strand:- start:700 stop:1134 length:435 start_codon:yes stop_codon:yes gene_type:complete